MVQKTSQSLRYHASDLSIIIPTKDRPHKLRQVLECLHRQTVKGFRVAIIDGGTNARSVVEAYRSHLDISYQRSPVAGQIQQRNLGIAHLTHKDHLVGFIDDDMELAQDAIECVIDLWNEADPDPAGIGFNLVESQSGDNGLFKRLFMLDKGIPGKVLMSGANTRIGNIAKNIRTQWLGGGYTIWRKDVILAHPHLPVKTNWAIGEDLRFSYPIGKQYPLWVCARARAEHNHIYRKSDLKRFAAYRGHKIAMASLFFVRSHAELRLAACYWMLIGLSLGRFINGVLRKEQQYLILEAAGMARAMLRSLAAGAGKDFLLSEMES